MTDPIAAIHYRELAEKEPQEVCRRVGCRYDRNRQCYELEVWGDVYHIYPHAHRIQRCGKEVPAVNVYLSIFIIHYLLVDTKMVVENEWITEKDIPGGPTFFRGPHAIPTALITETYQNDIETFGRRCHVLGGTPLDMGDAAFGFQITEHVPMLVLYWQGDEDFPPQASLLLDRSIRKFLALDVVFALAVEICTRIAGSGGTHDP